MSGEFVDTNVLVYAHDESAGAKRHIAVDLVVRLGRERAGLVSTQVLLELFATLTRKIRHPVPFETAAEIVADFASWRCHEPTVRDVLEASKLAARNQISIWDAMIVHAAAALGASVLWSEDLGDGQIYEGVPVRSPFADG